jgi:hypothetical protein
MPCQTFAAYWFDVPRRPLLERGAQSICDRLVRSWHVNDQKTLEASIEVWVADQMRDWQLSPECLSARLLEACVAELGQTPSDFCDAWVRRWAKDGPLDLGRQPKAIGAALAELEQVLGPPEREPVLDLPSPLMQALRKGSQTLAVQAEHRLAEMGPAALMEPQFRLTGVEDTAQHQLWIALGVAAQRQKGLSAEQGRLALSTYQSMAPLIDDLPRTTFLRWGGKARAATKLVELFRLYLNARWESAISNEVRRLCQELQVNLHKYQRQVACCRGRISQFVKSFADPSAGGSALMDLGLGRYLLPVGCRTLEEAVARLLESLTPEEERALHQKVHALIGKTLQAHVHVCTAPASLFKDLKETIHGEVERLAETTLHRAHAATVYLEQHADDPAVDADLAGAFAQAQPELSGSCQASRQELCILAVPPGPEGERFRLLVGRALPDTPMLAAPSIDDIVFYREHARVLLTELPQMGPGAREVYQQVLATEQFSPHSRSDIVAWLPTTLPSI